MSRVAHDAYGAYDHDMGGKIRTFTGEFKLRVATEALTGGKTVQIIATEHGVTTSLVCTWKKESAAKGRADVFR